ncbi:aminotransferase class I/II-fold pyridoxal phosphate-dependent enzyme [Desulfosporosinus fructosivorans]|uniref:Aminotransferase n=1 Tax=Desulfosporosinus fructosivorans TaxID=2018669 RepID=A0A4Z0R273_9FIRM|nr:aminotransferase class I/II-fold pyridoxal phosphate-dependent enzyme [Desulfosporosinus fructosivorans]TGE36599.1 aminotransferase class I/II-fold pyridoxal phosphate-dependent enzyme [Desulfosporosinus fructosivorans]
MKVTPFSLERFFSKTEFNVRYHLAASAIQAWSLRELLCLANDPDLQFSLFATRLGYTEPEGIPELRQEITRLYSNPTDPDHVFVTSGAIEANYLLLNSLLEPGDRFIVQTPYYQQLSQVGIDLGATALLWHYREDKGFDIHEFMDLLDQKPALVMLNTPHNPTGFVFSPNEMRQIAEVCLEREIYLLSDEVYRELGETLLPSMRDYSSQAVSIGSMSKSYGLAGLRVGWMMGPPEIIARCATKRDYTSLCSPALGQHLALTALKHRTKIWDRNRQLRLRNITLLEKAFKEDPTLRWQKSEAGVVAWVSYSTKIPSEQLGRELHRRGVLVAPGIFFGEEGHFRLGFGGNSPELEAGLAIMMDYFKQN